MPPVGTANSFWSGDENLFDVCMAISPQQKLQEVIIPYAGMPPGNQGYLYNWRGADSNSEYCNLSPRLSNNIRGQSPECGNPDVGAADFTGWMQENAPRYSTGEVMYPDMPASGSFLLTKRLRHARACKPPEELVEWSNNHSNPSCTPSNDCPTVKATVRTCPLATGCPGGVGCEPCSWNTSHNGMLVMKHDFDGTGPGYTSIL